MTVKTGIVLSSLDVDRLESLLGSLPREERQQHAGLQEELDRAEVVEPRDVPPDVVSMNSTVRFAMESGEEFNLTLVYPRDSDGSADKVSILAPVGSALLGLSVGEQIDWPKPGGGKMTVKIKEIIWQPERAGEFHR
ncbi:nucleoside diphosphate kinase regulator [Granulosicoccus sp. 3-233]|uniref:nucleoside diphosphate kinase regulator n=1 Tax=Granulosicoccus sp. 3-233 TaxID=3417969 RepID=UPI003D34142C